MKSFIGDICTVQLIGDLDCNDPLPPPPFPPDTPGDNPNHLYVPTDAGLAAATMTFTSASGAIAVRMYGRNNAANAPRISAIVTQGALVTPLTLLAESHLPIVDSSFIDVFAGFITPNVACTLTFNLEGSAGRTWVRVGDFGHLPSDFADTALYWENLSGSGVQSDYYVEIDPGQPEGSLMLSTVGWLDAGAAPIQSTGDYEQFTEAGGVEALGNSAYFGAIDSPGGEPGWGGYVWYSAGGQLRKVNGVVVALPGATLPTTP